jgi:D-threonate/D-erythronate kinase
MSAHTIELRRELATGIPQGILRGGIYDGAAVVTKSGGFGMMDDLIKVADYFHASKPGA